LHNHHGQNREMRSAKKGETKMNIKLSALLLALVCGAVPAVAAPSVVYVAFNGLDTNPCTRATPCKTITHALTVVAPGGVVGIATSGVYDTFTIATAVSVEADPGVVATIPVPSGGTGITVNTSASDAVTIKGLSVWGAGNGTGIEGNAAESIAIEDCVSRNVSYAAVLNSTTTAFKVTGGVYEGSDTSFFIRAGTNQVSIDGVRINETGSNAAMDAIGSEIRMTHSVLEGDGVGGFTPGVWVKGGATVVLEDDVISGYAPGVQVGGGTSGAGTVFLSNNTVTNNSTGVTITTGTGFTRSNNTIIDNATNVSGILTAFAAR
jgi:hypothetical protein